jgi:AcrR family transcriptional regulator
VVQTAPRSRSRPSASPARARRRLEILRAAAGVFRRKGFHRAGMREIAAALGVAPGALYYYFESKEDLLQACQEIALERLVARARSIVGSDLAPAAKVRALVAAHLELTLGELGGGPIHTEFQALPPRRLAAVIRKRDRYERLVRRVVEEGVASGAFRAVDPKLAALGLLGLLNWTVVWWRPEGRWSARDLVDAYAAQALGGLAATPPNGGVR